MMFALARRRRRIVTHRSHIISAQLKYNIDAVNEYIVKRIPIPVRDSSPIRASSSSVPLTSTNLDPK